MHVVVRRSRILQDTLHLLKNGLDTTKHIRVTFVDEPAVDQGSVYFRLLLAAIAANNSLLCGPDYSRTPHHHVEELERMTFFYIGVIIAEKWPGYY